VTTFCNKAEKKAMREIKSFKISRVPILFLVGGRGIRVRQLTNDEIPKSLIKITEDNTILDLICVNLQNLGWKNFIFCLGHHGKYLEEHLNRVTWKRKGIRIRFVKEELRGLLGTAGAAYKAIRKFRICGPTFILPGDMFLPWTRFQEMLAAHLDKSATITFGLTSVITRRTSDIGKIYMEKNTSKLVKCYGRTESTSPPEGELASLTSAGVVVVDAQAFLDTYASFIKSKGLSKNTPVDIRDDILSWYLNCPNHKAYGFNFEGEALDLGTIDNILYARVNWKKYMLSSL